MSEGTFGNKLWNKVRPAIGSEENNDEIYAEFITFHNTAFELMMKAFDDKLRITINGIVANAVKETAHHIEEVHNEGLKEINKRVESMVSRYVEMKATSMLNLAEELKKQEDATKDLLGLVEQKIKFLKLNEELSTKVSKEATDKVMSDDLTGQYDGKFFIKLD